MPHSTGISVSLRRSLRPNYPQAYCNRGRALQGLGRLEDAVESYGRAIALRPDHASAYTNRGAILARLERFAEALESYDRAIALLPDHPGLHANRGNALQRLKRFDEAIAGYDTAIALKPDYPDAYNGRGIALEELGRFDEAMASFDRALELHPDYAEPSLQKAALHLRKGQFDIGWRYYEARKRRREPEGSRGFGKPLWSGETSIAGKTILIHWEQGFGDVIQFSRYVRLLEGVGARVLFAPQRELKTLMRGLDAEARIVDVDADALLFDCHCPLMSLPRVFRTDMETIPSAGHLSADEEKVAFWRERLGRKTRPRVGIVWTGNVHPDRRRSIELEQFARLFDPRFEFVSLQKKVTDAERAVLDRAGVLHLGDAFVDFSDTAAACVLMDRVVSIDTAVAHLAGALGVPVWVLLPWLADWRWLLDRDDSPWYPTMRLFRQTTRGDWDAVLRRVELELHALSA
jgi:Tfp pilus assembly protein PilF